MTELSKYNLRYKNVICVAVDWEKEIYIFRHKKKIYSYKLKKYYSFVADTDKIRFVIELFLKQQPAV